MSFVVKAQVTKQDRINASHYKPDSESANSVNGMAWYKLYMWHQDSSEAALNAQVEKNRLALEYNEQSDRLKELTKKYGAVAAKKILAEKLWVGMTDKMLIEELTDPNNVYKNHTKSGTTDTWIYKGTAPGCIGGGCPYLDYQITIQNHKVIAIAEGQ